MWDSRFLGQSQKPGTVQGLWDCRISLGQSQVFGTIYFTTMYEKSVKEK